MGAHDYEDLKRHVGHDIKCVAYGVGHEYKDDPANVAIECWTCNEVLLDFDKHEYVSYSIGEKANSLVITDLQRSAIEKMAEMKGYSVTENLDTMTYAKAAEFIRKLNRIGQDSEEIT